MEGIKYVTLIEIIFSGYRDTGIENGEFVIPVNNILVCLMSF